MAALLLGWANLGICLNNEEIIMLKQAGVSNETIQLMVREKTIETCTFTVEEILDLKKAGLSEKTIQILVKEGSFRKSTATIVYGQDTRGIRFTTAKDLIALKEAGMSDEVIQALIVFGARDADDSDREKAWEMLNSMGILLDKRLRN
jgi:hypothetical protein